MIARKLILPLDFFMVLFGLSAAVAVFTSYDRSLSLPVLVALVASIGLYFAVSRLIRTWGSAWGFAMLLVFIGAGLSLYFLPQFNKVVTDTPGFIVSLGRPALLLPDLSERTGFGVHPNGLAMFIEGVIPLALLLLFSTRNVLARLLWLALTAVLLYALLLTFSRGAFIGLAVALGIAMLIPVPRLVAAGLVLLALGGGIGLLIIGPDRVPLLDPVLSWTLSRADLYQNSLYLGSDYALTGFGLGETFPMIYSRYSLLIQVPFLTYTHNLPLAVWLGQGILGVIALAGIVLAFYRLVYHVLRLTPEPRMLFHAAWLGVTATLVHSLFDARQLVDIWWGLPMFLALFGYAAAVGRVQLIETEYRYGEQSLHRVPRLIPVIAVVGVFVVGLAVLTPLRALWFTNQAALAETRAELSPDLSAAERDALTEQALTAYREALSIDPTQPSANRRLGNMLVNQGDYADGIPYLEAAWAREPYNEAGGKGLGLAYTWTGQIEAAVNLFQQLDIPAEMEEELYTWGYYWQEQDRPLRAAYAWETAIALGTNDGAPNLDVWMLVANTYRAAADMDSARRWYERILAIAPEHEGAQTALRELG